MHFRSAFERRGSAPGDRGAIVASVAEPVDTAGNAVAFSALPVLASLPAILIVPSPAFRSMAFGIMLSVVAVLAASVGRRRCPFDGPQSAIPEGNHPDPVL